MSFIKYSKSPIVKVYKDYDQLDTFIKKSKKNGVYGSDRLFKRISSISIFRENPEQYSFLRNRSISSREIYGPNMNWDAFPDKELKTKYATFLNCRIDVDHICNGDEDIIGMVVDSMYIPPQILVISKNELLPYSELKVKDLLAKGERLKVIGGYVENLLAIDNERAETHTPGLVTAIKKGEVTDTSMGCFPKETPITTKNGYVFIEDIKEGDEVLTHTGQYKKVKGLFQKDYTDGIFNIKVQGVGEEFQVTYEHPFYTITKEQLECQHPTAKIAPPATCHPESYENKQCQKKKCEISKDREYNIEWIKTQDLNVGDYVAYTFNDDIVEDENESVEFARILGYYLSDGCMGYSYKKGGIASCNTVSITFGINEQEFADDVVNCVKTLTGYEPKVRHYDNTIVVCIHNTEFNTKILEYAGALTRSKKLNSKVLKWKPETQLHILATFINGDGFSDSGGRLYCETVNRYLIEQLKQIASRNRIIWTLSKTFSEAGRGWNSKDYDLITWKLAFAKNQNHLFKDICQKCVSYNQTRWSNRKFYYKNYLFSLVSKIEYDEDWKGKIYNFEVEDDESYVANDTVVHNCSVKISECSVCNNKAKSEDEFCDHVLHMKGRMVEWKGKQKLAYEINHDIEFFEDSIILSDDFARKAGKSAQAGGEGADNRAKILEVLGHEDDSKSILAFVKKSNMYLGQAEEYIELGEEPQEITEEKDEMQEEKEEKYRDKKGIFINDKNVNVGRLEDYIKQSKTCKEFESYVSGLIGEELNPVGVIKVRSFYENKLKQANKNDLMALVKTLNDQGKTREQIRESLKKMNYKNDEIVEAIGYLNYKDGYTNMDKQSAIKPENYPTLNSILSDDLLDELYLKVGNNFCLKLESIITSLDNKNFSEEIQQEVTNLDVFFPIDDLNNFFNYLNEYSKVTRSSNLSKLVAQCKQLIMNKTGSSIKPEGDELGAPILDRYNDSLNDDGIGIKDEYGEKSLNNGKMENPLFAKIQSLKKKILKLNGKYYLEGLEKSGDPYIRIFDTEQELRMKYQDLLDFGSRSLLDYDSLKAYYDNGLETKQIDLSKQSIKKTSDTEGLDCNECEDMGDPSAEIIKQDGDLDETMSKLKNKINSKIKVSPESKIKSLKKKIANISSMGWRQDYKIGDYVKMTYNFGDKEVSGIIKELTNDDIWLEDGSHFGSLSWSAEKINDVNQNNLNHLGKTSGVNTEDHLKQDDKLSEYGAGWEEFDSIINKDDNFEFSDKKTVNLEDYKDHKNQDKDYQTDEKGMVQKIKSLKKKIAKEYDHLWDQDMNSSAPLKTGDEALRYGQPVGVVLFVTRDWFKAKKYDTGGWMDEKDAVENYAGKKYNLVVVKDKQGQTQVWIEGEDGVTKNAIKKAHTNPAVDDLYDEKGMVQKIKSLKKKIAEERRDWPDEFYGDDDDWNEYNKDNEIDLNKGDKVRYFINDSTRYGIVGDIMYDEGTCLVADLENKEKRILPIEGVTKISKKAHTNPAVDDLYDEKEEDKEQYKFETADELVDKKQVEGNMEDELDKKVKSIRKKLSSIELEENVIKTPEIVGDKDKFTWDEQDGNKKQARNINRNIKQLILDNLNNFKLKDVLVENGIDVDNIDEDLKMLDESQKQLLESELVQVIGDKQIRNKRAGFSLDNMIAHAITVAREKLNYISDKELSDGQIKRVLGLASKILVTYYDNLSIEQAKQAVQLHSEGEYVEFSMLKQSATNKKAQRWTSEQIDEFNKWLDRLSDWNDSLREELDPVRATEVAHQKIQKEMEQEGFDYKEFNIWLNHDLPGAFGRKKTSATNTPTELQPGSTVEVKDQENAQTQTQGQIQDVNTQQTPNGTETVVQLSDGKEYSTDDYAMDKQSMLKELQAIEFETDNRMDDLNEINSLDISENLLEGNEFSDEEYSGDFDEQMFDEELGVNVPERNDLERIEKKNIRTGFKAIEKLPKRVVEYGGLESVFED